MNLRKSIIFIFTIGVCFAFTIDVQKRMVRENGFDIECYISLKKSKNFDNNKIYYWFKSGRIHSSLANAGGYVLHNSCSKYYRSNQIAEQGAFNYGLKDGVWKSWYENGQLQLQEFWKAGYKDGKSTVYDSEGKIISVGDYRNNLKTGRWINYKTKDTTYHKNNSTYTERPLGLIERVLRKRDSLEKVQIKLDKIFKRKTDSLKRLKIKFDRKIKKQNDSIKKQKKKLNKIAQKKLDSINKHKNTEDGFFKKLFQKNSKGKKD
ncbi:hypothetical protein [Algibacter sp. 2305UL17-15]|uniref:toxin-antitoxin system YwqK family antitoxin n=1 Tax=Algibacter sp. 2305UL17-15 TaxID=3231268 RepID=UPI003458D1AF